MKWGKGLVVTIKSIVLLKLSLGYCDYMLKNKIEKERTHTTVRMYEKATQKVETEKKNSWKGFRRILIMWPDGSKKCDILVLKNKISGY